MTYDAIVVGGGLLGLSTAYHLVRQGARTLMIDRADSGRATDAGAGILSAETSTRDGEVWFELAIQATQYYPALLADLANLGAGDTGYARCGLLLVAAGADEVDTYEHAKAQIFARQKRRVLPSTDDLHEVSPAEARRYFPPLTSVQRALYHRNAARVDGRLLAAALRHAAERLGLVVQAGSVDRLVLTGGRVTGVVFKETATSAETQIAASSVVIAGGAWSAAFGAQLGVHIPVQPQRGQIVHLRHAETDTSAWTVVSAFHGHYMVPWPDGRIVAGATREVGSGFASRVTAAGLNEVLGEALRVAPGLKDWDFHEVRVGLRPLTPDYLPVLGAVPGVAGIYLATGHGPTGLTLGPFSGRIVADLALGRDANVDIGAFSAARFAKT
jgi:D-amino-acid dehydrogenase